MHDYFSGPLGIELKKNNLPLIFHSHLSADREFMDPYYSSIRDTRLFYEKVSCDNADIVIAVSQDTKESLVKAYQLPPEKIRVIENAIDTERFRPQKEIERQKNEEYLAALGITESHRPYIYWKGRLVHEKGADKLIRAFEIFSPNHPEYSLVMTGFRGSSEYYSELLNIRGKLPEKIRDKIIILNQQVDVIPFDQNCEFAVYPSSYEAFGLMAVQSEACAKTVVAGNGGLKHNVKGGVTGIHIDPYRPQSIAEGMEVAHQNKKGWGSNAREFAVENYSLKNRISDYTKIYEEALERA
jgi:glycosyltransferase involved in cell wall biosynthesis